MRVLAVLSSFLLCLSISGAWPWPPNLFSRSLDGRLIARDNPPKSSAAPASSAAQNTASNTGSATGSSAPSGTGSQSGSAPTSKPTGKDGDKNKGNSTSSVSINPENPAGGISMVNPAPTATTWYKYGNNITWVWNYTSLVITPSAIDVLVSCQDTASTFTVAQNVSVNATQSIIWDTSKETGAGITDKYTMVVFDAGNQAGVSATAAPGKLGVADFLFSIYTPQPYQGIGDGYTCVTCNGAISAAERQALGIMLTMASITVLSFGYFANGFLSL